MQDLGNLHNTSLHAGHNMESPKSHSLVISVISVCLVLIEITGIICNSVILTIYYKYTRLQTATNLFILNLALCNLLLAILDIIFSAPSSFDRKWLFNSEGCTFYGFCYLYLMSVAVCTLAVIAFDRFCVITKPVRNLRPVVLTKKNARIFILIIHVYSLTFAVPPLFGWNKFQLDNHFQTGCYINYADESEAALSYTLVSIIFTCIVPLILTSACYMNIYRSVKNSSKRSTVNPRGKMAKTESTPSLTKIKKVPLTHTRTARMIAVVMFFFLLTWLPVELTGLLRAFGVHVPPLVVYFCVLLAKSCVMYNAVVYVFLNYRFRAAFLHLTFLCRVDSRLRFATSMTNPSGRFGDIGGSISENYINKARLSKNLSQLSIIQNHGINQDGSSSRTSTDLARTRSMDGIDRGHYISGLSSRIPAIYEARVNEALEEEPSGNRESNGLSICEEHGEEMRNESNESISKAPVTSHEMNHSSEYQRQRKRSQEKSRDQIEKPDFRQIPEDNVLARRENHLEKSILNHQAGGELSSGDEKQEPRLYKGKPLSKHDEEITKQSMNDDEISKHLQRTSSQPANDSINSANCNNRVTGKNGSGEGSPEVIPQAYYQDKDIVLSDERQNGEKLQELNVNTLNKIAYV